MDLEAANRARDRRLRRQLLRTLHAARIAPQKGLHGRRLMELVDDAMPPGDRFESLSHALGLMRDLEAKDLASIADERTRRSQVFSLDYLLVRIAALGSSLINETAPVDPDIEDERIA
jgi:hypothetical protein